MSMMSDEIKDDALEGSISILRGITPPESSGNYHRELALKISRRKDQRETLTRAGVVAALTLLLAINSWFLSASGEQEANENREIAAWYGQETSDPYNE